MQCYKPLDAWYGKEGRIVFDRKLALGRSAALKLPCGQCIGCRLEYSRQWAVRCMHELQMCERSCFVTLTFDEGHLPDSYSVSKRDLQLFFKRLRKAGWPFRYFACGEYGENFGRPHYHACLFGMDFSDRVLYSVRDGVRLYTSEKLDSIWGQGECKLGDVTFESAAYVARYVCKKITGEAAASHYKTLVLETGELLDVEPEFAIMSRRGGLGKSWFEKFGREVYPDDSVVVRGTLSRPPRYYDSLVSEDMLAQVKAARQLKMDGVDPSERSYQRLSVKEVVKEAQFKMLKRTIE